MQCPKCRNEDLKPTKLAEGLPVMGCTHCEGTLLSLLYYRDWAERNSLTSDSTEAVDLSEQNDSKTALSCPKCKKLMTKFSVSEAVGSRLDLCTSCDEAWLDGGEWQLLKSLQLADKLPKVFTEQWQKKVRSEKLQQSKIERLTKLVGEADAQQAIEFKNWLKDNPNKALIAQFIGSD